ncbi:MAG: ASCH domain-containing protein [Armatimonadota bacterium]
MDVKKTKVWIIDIQTRWMEGLLSGEKKVEGKRNSKTWYGMKVGDEISFRCDGQTLSMRIVAIRKYKTLRRYLEAEGLLRTLPGVLTIKEGIALYREYWTKEEIIRDGILAIEVE